MNCYITSLTLLYILIQQQFVADCMCHSQRRHVALEKMPTEKSFRDYQQEQQKHHEHVSTKEDIHSMNVKVQTTNNNEDFADEEAVRDNTDINKRGIGEYDNEEVNNMGCSEPEQIGRLSIEEFADIIKYQTFSALPGRLGYDNIKSIPDKYINIARTHLFGRRKHRHHHSITINNLGMCQTEYVKNKDNNRKPEKLMETVCVSKVPSGDYSEFTCQSITQYVAVYRRIGCTNNVFDYVRVWEPLSVGCIATTSSNALDIPAISRGTGKMSA